MFKFKAFNSLVGLEVRSLKHHRIRPSNGCSVQRDLSFCRKRTSNVLPDPIGPAIIQASGCLNLTSVCIAPVKMTFSPHNLYIYTWTERTYYHLYVASWKIIFYKSYPRVLWLYIHTRHRFVWSFVRANCHGAVRTMSLICQISRVGKPYNWV